MTRTTRGSGPQYLRWGVVVAALGAAPFIAGTPRLPDPNEQALAPIAVPAPVPMTLRDADGPVTMSAIERLLVDAPAGPEVPTGTGLAPVATPVRSRATACGALPKPGSGDTFVAIAAEAGAGRSTASVERTRPARLGYAPEELPAQAEEGMSLVSRIDVEPGTGMVFLAVSARHSTVFSFAGAVERISAVVLDGGYLQGGNAPMTTVAAAGVPQDRLHFTTDAGCLARLSDGGAITDDGRRDLLASVFGRAPDLLSVQGRLEAVAVPSGKAAAFGNRGDALPAPKPLAGLTAEMRAEAPAGQQPVDARTVSAVHPVIEHGPNAGISGLMALVESGAVTLDADATGRLARIRVHKAVEWPYPPSPGGNPSYVGAAVVFDEGIEPNGPTWGNPCVLGDGGKAFLSGRAACAEALRGAPIPPPRAPRTALDAAARPLPPAKPIAP
jgi:hypothetical protein